MKHLASTIATMAILLPSSVFAHGGFSDGTPTFSVDWMFVTLFYSPLALVFAGCVALGSGILLGKRKGKTVRLSIFSALVAATIALGIYCTATAILVLVHG